MRKIIIVLILFLGIVVSCKKTETSDINIRRIDIEKATKSNISTLFDNIDFIPLETTDQGLTGLEISRMECIDDRMYLLNKMSSHSNILCFNKETGKFLFAIDRIGQGPDEYTYLGDFLIDYDRRNIVLLSENRRYLYFDLDGNFLFDKKANDIYFSRELLYLNDSTYLVYHDSSLPPEGYNILYLDANTLSIRSKSNTIQDYLQNTGNRPLHVSKERLLFYNANDSIYDIKKATPLYYVDLGVKHEKSKKELNALNQSNEEMLEKVSKLFQKHEFYLVYSLFENKKWLALNIYANAAQQDDILLSSFFLLFDKENEQLYDSRTLSFDILNLPPIKDVRIIGETDDEFYVLIKDNFSLEDIQKIEKGSPLNIEKIRRLTNRTSEDNPIIICLKNK
ncbi:6-bladed beta-propeller [Proteiniphilum saccharofermentans]|uniref:6-bladed beta-propeller n=1 Tax=Proteiniphilum saccharofermentans TaxID=1642647 RepID=UPI0028ADD73A|nr:6-bladed beta-propeller [Proteiniphilum saccharofermentans]